MQAQDILEALDRAQLSAEPFDPFPLRPSGLGRCQREIALILERIGEQASIPTGVAPLPNRVSPESLRIMERGHQRGEILAHRLQKALQAPVLAPVPLWVELPSIGQDAAQSLWERLGQPERMRVVDGALFLAGEADAVILDAPVGEVKRYGDGGSFEYVREPHQPWLIDFKAQGAYSYAKTRSGDVSYDYRVQLYAYATAVADMLGEFPRMALVIEAQDSDARKSILGGEISLVEISHEDGKQAWTKAMGDLAETVDGFLAGISSLRTPTVDPPKGRTLSWQCNYCKLGPDVCQAYGPVVNEGNDKKPKWKIAKEVEA